MVSMIFIYLFVKVTETWVCCL